MQATVLWCYIKRGKGKGITTAVETSLYAKLEEIAPLIDYVVTWIVDIKAVNAEKHFTYTKRNNKLILDNFKRLLQYDTTVWARAIAVPAIHTEQDVKDFAALLSGHASVQQKMLVPFHQYGEEKYRNFSLECPYQKMTAANPSWIEKMSNYLELPERCGVKWLWVDKLEAIVVYTTLQSFLWFGPIYFGLNFASIPLVSVKFLLT